MGKNGKKNKKNHDKKQKVKKIENVIISLKKNIKNANKKIKEFTKKTNTKLNEEEKKEKNINKNLISDEEKNRYNKEKIEALKIKQENFSNGKEARLKEQARLNKLHKAMNEINQKPTQAEIEEEEEYQKYILKAKKEANQYEMEQELNRKIASAKKQTELKKANRKMKREKNKEEKTKEERVEEFKKGIRKISGTGDVFKQLKEISEQGYEEMPNLENNEEER